MTMFALKHRSSSMNPVCPNCGSIIYSRRNKLCGVCGKPLPEDLLFSPEERRKWDQVIEDDKRRQANSILNTSIGDSSNSDVSTS